MRSYILSCDKNTTHKIRVCIHDTLRGYRKAMRDEGNKEKKSFACCLQLSFPNGEDLIAEIHFNKPHFTPDIIAHECFHAAHYRAVLMGKVLSSDEAEEFIAEGVQDLVHAILNERA